jgi:mevalonate kinase
MLMGEHAVLHGRHAVVAAVNRRISVTLSPRHDTNVTLSSSLGNWCGTLDALKPARPFRFLLEAARTANLTHGFDLIVDSDFPPTVGLGSSSAVTVAACAAFHLFAHDEEPQQDALLDRALTVIRNVQGGAGSGADAAAATYGGVLLYRSNPRLIEPINALPPITVRYVGYKTPTPEVIAKLETGRTESPERFERLFDRMDELSLRLSTALVDHDLSSAAIILNDGQSVMRAMGVSDPRLDELWSSMRAAGLPGAKISGAGLGDCVLGLGVSNTLLGHPVDVALDPHGVRFE